MAGIIINIEESLARKNQYNVLNEEFKQMYTTQNEAFEKDNPITKIFKMGSIDRFSEQFSSSVGMKSFHEVPDGAIAPIFNSEQGYSAVYQTKEFKGKYVLTQQVLEDGKFGQAKDDGANFIRGWNRGKVQYAMAALGGGLQPTVIDKTTMNLLSADTVDGTLTGVKNRLFSNAHKTLVLPGVAQHTQSNKFYGECALGTEDPAQTAKLADFLFQVKTAMSTYRNDRGDYVGVNPGRIVVSKANARLVGSLKAALSTPIFNVLGERLDNMVEKAFTVDETVYLEDVVGFKTTDMAFVIIDDAWNAANHGPEFTIRIPLTIRMYVDQNTQDIHHEGRERWDFNTCDWRGIAYCVAKTPTGTGGAYNDPATFTKITPLATFVKPVVVTAPIPTA